ncbi:MFS transporter (macronuclear) [Tetrahymena thermophila SB210]|uniref:Lysosomal dipeptide transporter MFSD1 n=1 Tax=Tetrahymena thermophila (strain SB210) TaxID=312017 RepID=Q23DH7_TETTS|nr:MFS transporter [Tetrahymena thermophila SB210]EAR94487.1 MFS transporter [Tetrahymena thermophila SB210]|eukprot:XP_001014709.1 MFS transporter [Tetrahymena thermophila SB210]
MDSENLIESANSSKPMSIRQTWVRWLALSLACLIMIGSYMCYDFPQTLQSQLQKANNYSDTQVNLLYSVYSFPNIILPLIGGYLIDFIGIRKGVFAFTFVLIIGQALCMISQIDSIKSYALLVVGRVVFGLGGENLSVTQSTIVSQWFSGKELSFALGLNISVSRLGSVIGQFMFPALYSSSNQIFVPLLVGTIFCAFSWGCGIGLNIMDKHADKQEGKKEVKLSEDDKIKLSDIKKLGFDYWLICISCVLNYVCFFPFMQVLQNYLINQFGMNEDNAPNFMSIPYFMSAALTPLIGLLVDRIGKRGYLLICASLIMVVAHFTMLVVPQSDTASDTSYTSYYFIIPFILFGIFYSLYAAVLWPCIPLVCEPKIVGTAFGITNCIQNGGLAIAPLVTAAIISGTSSKDNGYFYDQIFFICAGILCVIINICIFFVDKRKGGRLNKGFRELNAERVEEDDEDLKRLERNSRKKSITAKRSFAF